MSLLPLHKQLRQFFGFISKAAGADYAGARNELHMG
jgi:hypothetical protein